MQVDMQKNQWLVATEVLSNDSSGGDPCAHARDLTAISGPDGALVARWVLPVAILVCPEDGVTRTICLDCVIDRMRELSGNVYPKPKESPS